MQTEVWKGTLTDQEGTVCCPSFLLLGAGGYDFIEHDGLLEEKRGDSISKI